jgi:carbon monoxide dehydrogenase subunit G
MKVAGEFTFDGPRPAVWELLQDPEVLAKVLPGSERLERVADDQYEGAMRVGVGPVTAGSYAVKIALKDKVPPERYAMAIDGRGGLGYAQGTARVELEETGPRSTRMRYDADLQVGGKVAGVGQRLLESVARNLLSQGLSALNRELAARLASSP